MVAAAVRSSWSAGSAASAVTTSGTRPAAYLSIMVSERENRLPRSLARSALWRARMASEENEESSPKLISRSTK